jgi:adenylate cyclase
MKIDLQELAHCFQGVAPSVVATCDRLGVPNITYVSQIHLIDASHVALSCQFFNKTRRNLDQNPQATAEVLDPISLQPYRLKLRFLRSEKSGALFDTLSLRIDAIASHSGMTGIFKLLAADVFEVLEVEAIDGAIDHSVPTPPGPIFKTPAPVTELRGLQTIFGRISRAPDLEAIFETTLASLDELFQFSHSMVLLPDETGRRLVTIASHGYGESGVGAEVELGVGSIGTVAKEKKILRISGVGSDLRYGRAIRDRVAQTSGKTLAPEIPLPGLPDAQAQLVLPLLVQDRLIGVLAVESKNALALNDWHEAFLQVVANQIAIAVENAMLRDDAEDDDASEEACPTTEKLRRRRFSFYRHDDCVFVDDEYLIRNVPGKILWKILLASQNEERTEFSNRELRLDQSLGLPALRDNLESRLILLRKRLAEKCPEVKLVPTKRGRFALELGCEVDLVERD